MKKLVLAVMVAVLSLGLAYAAAADKAEGKKAEGKKAELKAGARAVIEGVVTVEKEGDTVKAVTIGEGDGKVEIFTKTGEGKKLVEMNGKTVKAVGKAAEVSGKLLFQVARFEEVK